MIRYTVTARAEVAEIIDYIARDNPVAAARIADLIGATVETAHRFPKSGRLVYRNVRALPVGRYRYRVYYEDARTAGIIVRNVRSTWRLPPSDLAG